MAKQTNNILERNQLTVREAAAALGLSTHTIRAWLLHRKIASRRIGRCVRIGKDEVDRILSESLVPRAPERQAR